MTPEEKAKELVEKNYKSLYGHGFDTWDSDWHEGAKRCALIAVDEILNNDSVGVSCDDNFLICDAEYWEGVKLEIQNYQP